MSVIGMHGTAGLAALRERLLNDLDVLELPAKPWVPARFHDGHPVRDVVVIGGGMCGLAALAALKLLGIDNVACVDRAPEGREGPWVTFARMETLRSPKQLTGPALGLPALTVRSWYEAQFGRRAWDRLDKIPRTLWMDYLVWYRQVLELDVSNDVEVKAVRPRGADLLAIETAKAATGEHEIIFARHVVLATGRDGLGGPFVPEFVKAVPRRFWAHSADDIDFEALRGKRVAVVGAGASAMDNAATALEAGAASLDLFIRRTDIPRINKLTGISSQGVVNGFASLGDQWKWKFLDYALSAQTPPPRDSTRRVSRHPNARFRLGSAVLAFRQAGDAVVVDTPRSSHELDFVIFATGFATDLSLRPELAHVAPFIKFWRDCYIAEPGTESAELSASPYLGPAFEFMENEPGSCPALQRIHAFNYPATLSHGKLSGDIPAVSEGARRLARGIASSLFVEDRETHFANLVAYDTPELHGDEWRDIEAAGRPAAAEA